jgi:periplasmic copper chaperone A
VEHWIRPIRNRALAYGLALIVLPAGAASTFAVTEPWIRVAPNGRSAEGYMELRSSEGATLVGVGSDVAADIAILPGGTARASGKIALPAGRTIKLVPGGPRITLTRLSRPLQLGDRVDLVLTVEAPYGKPREIPVNAEVRRHSPTEDHLHPHSH